MFILFIFAGMEQIYEYYQENIEAYTRRVNNLKKRIHLMGTIRLLLVAGMFVGIWFARGYTWPVIAGTILAFITPVILLMMYHTYLAHRRQYAETLIRLCQDELNGLNYDYSAFDGAADKINGEHSFTLDLDIFGEKSIFQSINRTVTFPGREILAGWFQHPLHDKQEIINRQEAVRELAQLSRLRHHFYVVGKLSPGEKNDKEVLSALSRTSSYFLQSSFWKIMIWFIPSVWIVLATCYAFGFIPYIVLVLFFFVSLYVAYARVKQMNKLHASVNRMETIYKTYSQLIRTIEGDEFKSSLLTHISQSFLKEKTSASKAINQLSRLIGKMDQRGSGAGIILNIFTLRDTRTAIGLEKWIETYAKDTERWFEALGQFDALSSLGGFAFNHPDYTYPAIAADYFVMEGKGLGHPLLNRDVCIRNDIDIEKTPWFQIVTGANMAGKSTYLRTIGVNYLLACIGAPVCAEQLTVYPASLVTSLRTSDSLTSNESYFFAELKRLKMIIDRLRAGEKLFIILDEILKGTNSVDKQKGSLALIKQFISYNTCGIIATHDLILGSLQEEFPDKIRNYRFEADITGDELTFTYTLREGIAQNMNACFLMNKMGITVEGK